VRACDALRLCVCVNGVRAGRRGVVGRIFRMFSCACRREHERKRRKREECTHVDHTAAHAYFLRLWYGGGLRPPGVGAGTRYGATFVPLPLFGGEPFAELFCGHTRQRAHRGGDAVGVTYGMNGLALYAVAHVLRIQGGGHDVCVCVCAAGVLVVACQSDDVRVWILGGRTEAICGCGVQIVPHSRRAHRLIYAHLVNAAYRRTTRSSSARAAFYREGTRLCAVHIFGCRGRGASPAPPPFIFHVRLSTSARGIGVCPRPSPFQASSRQPCSNYYASPGPSVYLSRVLCSESACALPAKHRPQTQRARTHPPARRTGDQTAARRVMSPVPPSSCDATRRRATGSGALTAHNERKSILAVRLGHARRGPAWATRIGARSRPGTRTHPCLSSSRPGFPRSPSLHPRCDGFLGVADSTLPRVFLATGTLIYFTPSVRTQRVPQRTSAPPSTDAGSRHTRGRAGLPPCEILAARQWPSSIALRKVFYVL
jgi:hypothetical protein